MYKTERLFSKDLKIKIRYKEKEFRKLLAKGRIFSFVINIKNGNRVDMGILESWKEHLKSVKAPYMITDDPNDPKKLVLWKEEIAPVLKGNQNWI